MEMRNKFNRVGENATFYCIMCVNTTQGLQHINETNNIEWSFLPVGSSEPVIILRPGHMDAPAMSEVKGHGEDTGQSGYDTTTKYVRSLWRDMTIQDIGIHNAGTYRCRHTQFDTTVSAELYVVDSDPVCSIYGEGGQGSDLDPVYYAGDNLTFTCQLGYHGNQAPTLSWKTPKLHIHTMYGQADNEVNKLTQNLTIELEHMIDGKLFECGASFVNISSGLSCSTMLPPQSVKYAAFITHLKTWPELEEHDPQVAEGTNVTLWCAAHGNPMPKYSWSYTRTLPDGSTDKTELPCPGAQCIVPDVRCTQSGAYMCGVKNIIKGLQETDSKSISIKVISESAGICDFTPHTDGPDVETLKEKPISPYAIGAVVCASLAVILIIVFVIIALKMRRRERHLHQRLTRMHDENLDDQEVELLDENIQPDNSELPIEYSRLKQQWEIARKDIRLVDLIAKGSFVEVWQGRMRKYPRRNDIMKVAIKRIVSEATEKERRFFLAELEVMKALQPHPNILPLIGCYTASDPWLMMVEYAIEGSLYQYLQQRRPGDPRVTFDTSPASTVSLNNMLSATRLLTLAAQVVSGLQHINRYKMIFYRLRSAGVLVCKGGVCKLSGFGFTHDITERNVYESNSAPVRWMSPESLQDNVFNMKTDVWSFGIVLWEIVHFGHLPYPDMGPQEVTEKIQAGYRMPQPPHCSSDIYNLMLMCWAEGPDNRPSLGDVMQSLSHLATNPEAHIHLDRLPAGLRTSDIHDTTETIA